jgi:ATP-dependent DNA helicase RecQ
VLNDFAPMSDELLEVLRKVLSGVARTRGRFGKHIIAQMLCGSNNAKMKRFGLQRLSTYGLLGHFRQDEVVEILDALLSIRCLEQAGSDAMRPTVRLTEPGKAVMTGASRLDRPLPLSPALAKRFTAGKPHPPATPRSEDRRERSGTSEATRTASAGATGETHADGRPPETQPTHYWTWRLLSSGFSVEECMVVRGCERDIVLDHALRAADEGWRVEMSWLLSAETIQRLTEAIGTSAPSRIRPLLPKLPGVRYEEVQFFLKCRSPADAGLPGDPGSE